jgi:hypothetical protein
LVRAAAAAAPAPGICACCLLGLQGWQRSLVTITWSTASELDTAGFNLYRNPDPEGEFERVNPALIPSRAEPLTGGEYSYADAQVLPGQVYYYELEAVNLDGSRERLGRLKYRHNAVVGQNCCWPWFYLSWRCCSGAAVQARSAHTAKRVNSR